MTMQEENLHVNGKWEKKTNFLGVAYVAIVCPCVVKHTVVHSKDVEGAHHEENSSQNQPKFLS